ncbi:hypothetical protein LJC33_06540 [Eubacteriales bacterium OttesenSCG-928-N13]|nr:hypothetical protein [Eubacteriales bacterium OttesenSCG-928-N13]
MITCDNYPERWEDVPAGTEISETIYNDMLNVMPPISIRGGIGFYAGFQMGEAYDHQCDETGKFRARYMTFVNIGDRYFYAGICFGGRCDWRYTIKEEAL